MKFRFQTRWHKLITKFSQRNFYPSKSESYGDKKVVGEVKPISVLAN